MVAVSAVESPWLRDMRYSRWSVEMKGCQSIALKVSPSSWSRDSAIDPVLSQSLRHPLLNLANVTSRLRSTTLLQHRD